MIKKTTNYKILTACVGAFLILMAHAIFPALSSAADDVNKTVSMIQEGQDVRLEVQDWGAGFDTKAIEKGHFGLESIRQRARLLGGRLTIESKPGSGTLVQAIVPILEKQIEGSAGESP